MEASTLASRRNLSMASVSARACSWMRFTATSRPILPMPGQHHLAETARAEGSHELISGRQWRFLVDHFARVYESRRYREEDRGNSVVIAKGGTRRFTVSPAWYLPRLTGGHRGGNA